jgi:hypothetical protein
MDSTRALVALDTKIDGVYALDGVVVYHRAASTESGRSDPTRPWTRLVDGRRLAVHGIPAGAHAGSMGRDARGRTVLTVATGGPRDRWWLYDVRADRASRLRGLHGCAAGAVAVWGSRIAYFDDCSGDQAVVLHEPGGTRRFPASSEPGFEQVALRRDSLAAMGEVDEDMTIFRLLDRGHRCTATIGGGAADGSFWAHRVSIANGRLVWVMARQDILETRLFSAPTPVAVALDGRCSSRAPQQYLGTYAGDTPLGALTVDERTLYYATERGLYAQRLPERGSTTPPPNDNVAGATPLTGQPPLHAKGVVGNATRQAGEPFGAFRPGRTVWYSWRARASERVTLGFAPSSPHTLAVFTGGPRVSALTEVHPAEPACIGGGFDIVANQTYWLQVGSFGPAPNFEPFSIGITRDPPTPC